MPVPTKEEFTSAYCQETLLALAGIILDTNNGKPRTATQEGFDEATKLLNLYAEVMLLVDVLGVEYVMNTLSNATGVPVPDTCRPDVEEGEWN